MNKTTEQGTMPDEIKRAYANLTKFQRQYAEYRSRGFNQGEAAIKAGSTAKGHSANRTGYNCEQKPEVKAYMDWLMEARAIFAAVESSEIIDNARTLYATAFNEGKYREALNALELLANLGGLLNKGKQVATDQKASKKTNNNVDVFKEEHETTEDRAKKINKLLKSVSSSSGSKS